MPKSCYGFRKKVVKIILRKVLYANESWNFVKITIYFVDIMGSCNMILRPKTSVKVTGLGQNIYLLNCKIRLPNMNLVT